jgi:hypothetical protein
MQVLRHGRLSGPAKDGLAPAGADHAIMLGFAGNAPSAKY